jgi:hypothetical protein
MPECRGEGKWEDVVGRSSLVVGKCGYSINPCWLANRRTTKDQRPTTIFPVLHCFLHNEPLICTMLLSKDYVSYLAREVTKKLIAGKFIETKATPAVTEKVHAAILEELSLEDRINDEVRVILETYSAEMQKTGANYQEMFRKVKNELVRKYKAVL